MAKKTVGKAKKSPNKPTVEADDWTYEREQLFGENRKLNTSERNLVALYMKDLQNKLTPAPEGRRWVMLMLVDLSNFSVIEHAAVSSRLTDEDWRLLFQNDFVRNFAAVSEEVAEAAFPEYKRGERRMHVLCMRYDNLYLHMSPEEQEKTRRSLGKILNRKLHNQQRKRSTKKGHPPKAK